ncbi:MAG: YHYH protein [Polyangiaceae bacterium]|nr:YHYH protein [Polyangiaceae bacterium]
MWKSSRSTLVSTHLAALWMTALTAACSGGAETTQTGGSGPGGGGSGGSGASTVSSGGGGAGGGMGGTSDCWQAKTMLDLTNAKGAGASYPKPELTAACQGGKLIVDGNGIPHYTFVQTTPNALVTNTEHYEITLTPQIAAQTTEIPLLGTVGFAVNGQPFFGPNEGAVPADEAYGDPIYNGLMDPCLGHTAFAYHYHSMDVKCLNEASLVAEPWMNADPPADERSPVIGWALDGFPVYGSLECTDSSCSTVVEMKSSYVKVGDPHSHVWDAYEYQAQTDSTYLDECNGHVGPDGDYHYHVTAGFPYILGCYKGTPNGAGMDGTGQGGAGQGGMGQGGNMGPQSCVTESDCQGACPPGSLGCTCNDSPMGKICVPTCTTSADCPSGGGMTLQCMNGICVPG